MTNIDTLFHTQRIESTTAAFVVILYFPLGCLLLLLRLFLTLNYVCSQIFFNMVCSPENVIRRFFEKLYLAVLGVVVFQNNEQDNKSLAVANCNSHSDAFLIGTMCNYVVLHPWKFGKLLMDALHLKHHSVDRSTVKTLYLKGSNVLIFPEPCPTAATGFLKFSAWAFAVDMPVQPVVVKAKRLLPITMSTIGSNWWHDLLWTYFSPYTLYDVTMLPSMIKSETETKVEFSERVRKKMADEMGVPCTNYTTSDVKEYVKRLRFEARKPQQHMQRGNDWTQRKSPRTVAMAKQVKDILPHVPLPVIVHDIEKTRSVDATVANILEGVVRFVPEEDSAPSTSSTSVKTPSEVKARPTSSAFSRSPDQRHMSLQERKQAFLKEARETYMRRKGLL